jgi:hypothetical protein
MVCRPALSIQVEGIRHVEIAVIEPLRTLAAASVSIELLDSIESLDRSSDGSPEVLSGIGAPRSPLVGSVNELT